jgi:predicted homoserine dehydrogenase-like protein
MVISPIDSPQKARIGLIGTGFMARGTVWALEAAGFQIAAVLTRRSLGSITNFPDTCRFTHEIEEFVELSDVILDCCGDPVHVTNVVHCAFQAGLPVVTLDSEFHVTVGSAFVGKGILTEAEGDQPGCLAALRREALDMGFEPLVYGNVKGFLNRRPNRADMQYFAAKQGTSLEQTVAFTDGTKLQIENALVANAFDAKIYRPGLLGPEADSIEDGSRFLGDIADRSGCVLCDYIMLPDCPSVFITAKHQFEQRPFLSYLKLGDGPYYTLIKNHHLCHLEVVKSIKAVLRFGKEGILLDNSSRPKVSVATIAKERLKPGDYIERGIGSFDVRGEAIEIADDPDHVPIGLMSSARVKREIEPGDRLTFQDVELPDSLALELWNQIVAEIRGGLDFFDPEESVKTA